MTKDGAILCGADTLYSELSLLTQVKLGLGYPREIMNYVNQVLELLKAYRA